MKRFWQNFSSWNEAERAWDQGAHEASCKAPLKTSKHTPKIPGITQETKKFLKFKSLKYLITHNGTKLLRYVRKKPIRYVFSYVRSTLKKASFRRVDDFFLYGFKSLEQFKEAIKKPDTLLVMGFSFCQKPLSCPSGRFTDQCRADPQNPTCRQCFIGKCVNALPKRDIIPLFIPTVHYIGEKLFEIMENHPKKQICFVITACELSLTMFADFGKMVGIRGVGVRLDGRICNTFRAFELAERGIKPGVTFLQDQTEKIFLSFLK
jgi:hypothetical protein